jgi:hypothetical protein
MKIRCKEIFNYIFFVMKVANYDKLINEFNNMCYERQYHLLVYSYKFVEKSQKMFKNQSMGTLVC